MGGPLSVMFSDIYMTKLEKDTILTSRRAKLYKLFIDDIFAKRITNLPEQLSKFLLYNYHPYEINPDKFFDIKICYNNSSVTTKVHQRVTKLTPHWSSSIPRRYSQNAVYGDLCSGEHVLSDCNNEKILICQKFDNAVYQSPHK